MNLKKKWKLEEKNWLKSVDLEGLKFGFGWGSCLESVRRGLRARLIPLPWYQTSSWLVQGLAEPLWDGIAAAVCVPRLPKSSHVRGLLGSWQSSTAHTDSTLLLTDTTARLRSKHTCAKAWVLEICTCTHKNTHEHKWWIKFTFFLTAHPAVCWPARPLTAVWHEMAPDWTYGSEKNYPLVMKHADRLVSSAAIVTCCCTWVSC